MKSNLDKNKYILFLILLIFFFVTLYQGMEKRTDKIKNKYVFTETKFEKIDLVTPDTKFVTFDKDISKILENNIDVLK